MLTVRTRRITLHVGESDADYGIVNAPADAVAIARSVIGDNATETVIILLLNARHRVTGYTEVCHGTLNASRFTPRDVLVPAFHANAAAIIMAHNHPSGDPTPSAADRTVSHAVRVACEMVGLKFLDSIVVTADRCTSILHPAIS